MWRDDTSYGKRWVVEGFFSCMKRELGEDAIVRKHETPDAQAVYTLWACYAKIRHVKT